MDGNGDRVATADLHSQPFTFYPSVTTTSISHAILSPDGTSRSMVLTGTNFLEDTLCAFDSSIGTKYTPALRRSTVEAECKVLAQ